MTARYIDRAPWLLRNSQGAQFLLRTERSAAPQPRATSRIIISKNPAITPSVPV
jgi:hypothetical protein